MNRIFSQNAMKWCSIVHLMDKVSRHFDFMISIRNGYDAISSTRHVNKSSFKIKTDTI